MAEPRGSTDSYRCAKCRGREAISQDLDMPRGALLGLLTLKTGRRYRAVTCALCGYTEFFDLAIVAKDSEPVEVAEKQAALDASQGA